MSSTILQTDTETHVHIEIHKDYLQKIHNHREMSSTILQTDTETHVHRHIHKDIDLHRHITAERCPLQYYRHRNTRTQTHKDYLQRHTTTERCPLQYYRHRNTGSHRDTQRLPTKTHNHREMSSTIIHTDTETQVHIEIHKDRDLQRHATTERCPLQYYRQTQKHRSTGRHTKTTYIDTQPPRDVPYNNTHRHRNTGSHRDTQTLPT